MSKREKLIQLIFRAVDQVNGHLPNESHLEKSLETILSGEEAKLDSLGLISLIVALEQELEKEFGISVTLVDETTMSQDHNPFRTIRTLADYATNLLEEDSHG